MYKNQLQEFAQRSCINLPSYSSIREGPDHAPRFRVKVNFNGEISESPKFCSTLRQAEHAAAEVALRKLSERGPSKDLAAKVLDETGVYKNLIQETAHRAGLKLPVYTTVRAGPGYNPEFTCTVELGGMSFSGEPAKTKKQAQKSAAMAAWFALKEVSQECSSSYPLSDLGKKDEQEQVIVARYLSSLKLPETRKSGQREKGKSVKEDVIIPYGVGRPSIRMQHENSTFSYLSPEWIMYQTWHQGIPQQHNHLLAVPSASTSILRPRMFPFIQSIFRPDIGSNFWAREQESVLVVPETNPFFISSNNFLPLPDSRESRVTIEEIEEINPIQERWLSKDVNPRNNFLSSVSEISTLDASSQRTHQNEEFSWLPHGFICNRSSLIEAREARLQLQNLDNFGSSWSGVQNLHLHPNVQHVAGRNVGALHSTNFLHEVSNQSILLSTPTRNAGFTCSTRPRPEGMKHLRPCGSQMAPAVQIRSVMPVCSSPIRRVPSPPSSREGTSSQDGIKRAEATGNNVHH